MRLTRVLVLLAALGAVAAIAVPAALGLAFVEGYNPPSGTQGVPYGFQYKAYAGCPPYTFTVISGSLPPGLSLGIHGDITGTPTTPGQYSFWVALSDEGCHTPSAQRPFTINIGAKLTVTSPSPLTPASVGTPYGVKLTADGGGSQTWSIVGGALPPGFTLGADGTLSGTPTQATAAPASFVVQVTDGSRTDTKTLTLDVVSPLAVTVPAFKTGEAEVALKPATATATGGRGPYAWSLAGAPSWLTIDPGTGAMAGTPDAAGAFPVQVSAKDAYGTTATVSTTVTVKGRVSIKTAKLVVTKAGKLYRFTLRTTGGVGPFKWKVTSGRFPVGIRLNRATGVLSGKARKAGSFDLTFSVTDALGQTFETETPLTLTVNPVGKKKR